MFGKGEGGGNPLYVTQEGSIKHQGITRTADRAFIRNGAWTSIAGHVDVFRLERQLKINVDPYIR